MLVGIIWISFIFVEIEKTDGVVLLKETNSFELDLEFTGTDIGFYRVYMPEFAGEAVFIQILDVKGNVIQEERIQTKMSVGYFNFDKDGVYTAKIANISENPVDLQLEFGNTNSKEMTVAGILILVGVVTMMVMSYLKIKNYSMEQPDENIS